MPSQILPPELYQMNVDSGQTTVTIYTALDQLVLTQDSLPPAGAVTVAPDRHLVVYADTVIVRGPLSLPGKNVSIYARVVGSQKDSNNNPASIDVSGAPAPATAVTTPKLPQAAKGADKDCDDEGCRGSDGSAGATGASGANGNNGGNISLYMESDFQTGTVISLLADGSPGAPGADGSAGQDGGDGGDGWLITRANPSGGARANIPGTRGGDGGNGGNGGTGGSGGVGGSGGKITAVSVLASNRRNSGDLNLIVSAQGGACGAPGNGGAGGNGGKGGQNGPRAVGSSSPGNNGAPGGLGWAVPVLGSGGTLRLTKFDDLTFTNPLVVYLLNQADQGGGQVEWNGEMMTRETIVLDAVAQTILQGIPQGTCSEGQVQYSDLAVRASVTQRSMTLQKAKLLYQTADPDSNSAGYGQAATLLAWLRNTTAYFATTPPPTPDGFTAADVSMMASINSQATALACQLTLKRDFYGNLPSYVPQGSLTFYQDQLSQMLGDGGTFQAIENNYVAYTTALTQQQASSQQLATAQSQATALTQSLQTQQVSAGANATALVTTIDADQDAVENQERVLRHAIQAVEDDLASYAGPNCVLDSMLKALNMVATFTDQSDLKLASQISGIVNNQALQPGLALAVGSSSFPTRDMVQQVDVLGDNVQSLNEGYTAGNGMVTEADPNAYKLLAAQTDIDTLLDHYRGIASAQEAIDAINLYVTLVQKRNADILKFNGYVAQISSLQSQAGLSAAQANQIAHDRSLSSNPSLAPVAAFITRLYHDARDQVIHTIYMASRSYAFWSLKPTTSSFSSFFGVDDPSGLNAAALSSKMQSILTDFATAIETFGTGPQSFPNTDGNSQPDNAAGQPPQFALTLTAADNPGLFETFKTQSPAGLYQLSFSMPAVRNGAATNGPFGGFANVRLSKVRPWIHGATKNDPDHPTNHVLQVAIEHSGAETIVDQDDNPQTFTHEPITKIFMFDYTALFQPNAIMMDGDFDTKDETRDYAQPGPFTVWTITVDPKLNHGLDMSNVDQITIEFWGNAYGFNP